MYQKTDFEPFLKDGCYDVVMPDVKYVGGPIKMVELANYIKNMAQSFLLIIHQVQYVMHTLFKYVV